MTGESWQTRYSERPKTGIPMEVIDSNEHISTHTDDVIDRWKIISRTFSQISPTPVLTTLIHYENLPVQ